MGISGFGVLRLISFLHPPRTSHPVIARCLAAQTHLVIVTPYPILYRLSSEDAYLHCSGTPTLYQNRQDLPEEE